MIFHLAFHLRNSHNRQISRGTVRFLVEHAPHEYLLNYHSFDIYEGPHLVAHVFALNNDDKAPPRAVRLSR